MSTIHKHIKADIAALPDKPGVYFFLDGKKRILYIGKATSLRSRVRSYFTGDIEASRSTYIRDMVGNARYIDHEVTDSVLEALLLEAYLIKAHKPRYNTDGKDDKSFNFVVITNEIYPRVLTVRSHELEKKFTTREIKYLFGPFPHGGLFKEAMKLMRKIFPYYDTKYPVGDMIAGTGRNKIEFNRQIGLYPPKEIDREAYARTINHLRLFFQGKKKQLVRTLLRDMKTYAKVENFEQAEVIKRRMYALTHIQDVSLIREDFKKPRLARINTATRIEAYDIAHLSGSEMVGVMSVVENGYPEKSEYRRFKIKRVKTVNDTASLKEVLERRLGHTEWQYPHCIVVDGGKAQLNAATSVLSSAGVAIPIVGVVKDEHHRPKGIIGDERCRKTFEKEILLANSESHRFAIAYHRLSRRKTLR